MKKSILSLGVALAITTSAPAQTPSTRAEKAAENVTMKAGYFWPNFEVAGKTFYQGS